MLRTRLSLHAEWAKGGAPNTPLYHFLGQPCIFSYFGDVMGDPILGDVITYFSP